MRKIFLLSITLLVMALLGVPSCAPTVPQQEYDRVSEELSAMQSQLALLQDKLTEAELVQAKYEELSKQHDMVKSEREAMQAQYDELSTEYEELNKQFDPVKSAFETMQAQYEELSTEYEELNNKYEELSEQYDALVEEPGEFNEEDVEQAVFKLVNQERKNNGLDELMWGDNIYKWAIANSRTMVTNKQLEYSEAIGWQDIFWATGYSTADEIANAALTVWKNHREYERNFLSEVIDYGAVAVYKSGEIFYITYVADYFQ
ncbi:MAG: CAP domain-containing protein [Dehalococcoidales bacterium]